MSEAERWAGVDVGGRRKGFDLAVVDRRRLVAIRRLETVEEAVGWLRELAPRIVAVDCPRDAARAGERSRSSERRLVAAGVCGIRYTPSAELLRGNERYYDWVLNGLALYRALLRQAERAGWEVVECFPTASWTRWGGPRGGTGRAAWSSRVLARLGVEGLPRRMGQDARDAVGAALTARDHAQGCTEAFGDIVVPLPAPSP